MGLKEVDRQLLLNYLDGKCSRDQLLQIREYLHDEAYRESLNQFMQEEWDTMDRQQFPPLPGMDDQYKKFRSAYIEPQNRTPVRRIRRMAAIAAVLVLAVAGTWLLLSQFAGRPAAQGAATQWLSWHNEPGHHSGVVLPDSTRVDLGPGATLRYGQNDGQSRLVQLEGEAYFVIKQDQRRPFTVVSGALSTRDLGTEFDIRYYPGEPSIAIAVASGKVQVLHTPAATSPAAGSPAATSSTATSPAAAESTAPLAALTPGQLFEYDSLTQKTDITNLPDPSLIGAWRKGILSFRRQPLKAVTAELERNYGVQFQYTDLAQENILITTLLDNKTLGDALDILSLTAGVHFTREHNRILIQ